MSSFTLPSRGALSGDLRGNGDRTPRLLVVEDERAIAEGLRFNFEADGFAVTVAGDGPTALAAFEAAKGDGRNGNGFDGIILDLMLPGMSGYEICRTIRRTDPAVPILMLTARTLTEDKIGGFEAGADQYLTKPFVLPELLARVRAMLSRPRPTQPVEEPSGREPVQSFGAVTIDFDAFRLTVARGEKSRTHDLTTQEAALLRLFAENPGRVLSRQEILRKAWPSDADVTARTIDNFVLRLRRMLEPDPANPKYLVSVRGTGYRFEPGEAT
ncbi:response regulator transcription factor [Alienimonas chondri]|uniref:Sensory transduction protein regX3 n=1 Tax=Alienimonas chondri TaxID=2681879 RepID=A0ABX1VCW4_9PLAN|nr:response regulator transcription factor [Alienimonas chondri]NNJ25067.1 Sensory transduction protein regX3 [Alienimonas chondri]